MFVCFEGIDGAGKSTQAHMLYNTLAADGLQVELVRDPGTTRLGDAIRKLILECDEPITSKSQALLFSAARAELSAHIEKQLDKGKTVICDRWLMSTLVYQTTMPRELILSIFNETSIVPDICFLLDLLPATADERRPPEQRKDRYERASLSEKHARRQAYLRYSSLWQCGKTVSILDATLPEAEIHKAVVDSYARCLVTR